MRSRGLMLQSLVYKALVAATDLAAYFSDLRSDAYETAFAIFHQRFSTNTAPSWKMTQPFRLIAHNGEINTIVGNRRWMHARGQQLVSFDPARGNVLALRHHSRIQIRPQQVRAIQQSLMGIVAVPR